MASHRTKRDSHAWGRNGNQGPWGKVASASSATATPTATRTDTMASERPASLGQAAWGRPSMEGRAVSGSDSTAGRSLNRVIGLFYHPHPGPNGTVRFSGERGPRWASCTDRSR